MLTAAENTILPPLAPTQRAVAQGHLPPRRVLLVADAPLLDRGQMLLLQQHGLHLHTAPSAEAALVLIAREPPYSAIVTDLRLPGMSCQEMARKLREPRLVVISSDDRALDHLRHFDARLRKPCSIDGLLAAIFGEPPEDPDGPMGHA